jgi:hypothetical protein
LKVGLARRSQTPKANPTEREPVDRHQANQGRIAGICVGKDCERNDDCGILGSETDQKNAFFNRKSKILKNRGSFYPCKIRIRKDLGPEIRITKDLARGVNPRPVAKKVERRTSTAEAAPENKALIAALKRCTTQTAIFSQRCAQLVGSRWRSGCQRT